MGIRLAIALLLLSIGAAHADAYMNVCGISSFDQEGPATAYIIAAFMLSSLAIALAYMYGKLTENPNFTEKAKDESYNMIISVLLFASLLVFFTGSCEIAKSYTNKNPFASSQDYLNYLLNANGQNVLRTLTFSSLNDQFTATHYLYTGMTPFYGSGAAYDANRKAFSSHKEFVIDLYLPMIASLTAQKYILETIQVVGVSLLLPFAFIMRLVPPTREFGNTLIALFFGVYIVVPTLYAMSGNAFLAIAHGPIMCTDCTVHNFYSYGIDEPGARWQGTMFYKIGSTLPQAIFLPNLVIVVTVTCVMAFSKALRAMAV